MQYKTVVVRVLIPNVEPLTVSKGEYATVLSTYEWIVIGNLYTVGSYCSVLSINFVF